MELLFDEFGQKSVKRGDWSELFILQDLEVLLAIEDATAELTREYQVGV
jgi:hypothetical protein